MFLHRKNRRLLLGSLLVGSTLLLSSALLPGPTSARMDRAGGPDPERALARLTEELDLTEEQQERVRAILEEGAAEREILREEMRKRITSHKDAMHERMATVLDEAQMHKLDQMREDSKGGCWECPCGDREDCCGEHHKRRRCGPGDCGKRRRDCDNK